MGKNVEISNFIEKLSTSENAEIWQKKSYTPSYAHYPHKRREKKRFT